MKSTRAPSDVAHRSAEALRERSRRRASDAFRRETFALGREAAREKARELFRRYPTAEEKQLAQRLISEKGKTQAISGLQWVLLNNPEFLLNH